MWYNIVPTINGRQIVELEQIVLLFFRAIEVIAAAVIAYIAYKQGPSLVQFLKELLDRYGPAINKILQENDVKTDATRKKDSQITLDELAKLYDKFGTNRSGPPYGTYEIKSPSGREMVDKIQVEEVMVWYLNMGYGQATLVAKIRSYAQQEGISYEEAYNAAKAAYYNEDEQLNIQQKEITMKYKGQLTMHSEMCCGAWPQFHDDRGLHGENKEYWNWGWTINFSHKTKINNITIFDDDGLVLYNGPWTGDRKKTSDNNYFACPKEMGAETWKEFVSKKLKCIIETDEVVDALKNQALSKALRSANATAVAFTSQLSCDEYLYNDIVIGHQIIVGQDGDEDVAGKDVLVIDSLLDNATPIKLLSKSLYDKGARSVSLYLTKSLSDSSMKTISESNIQTITIEKEYIAE